MKIAFDAKRAFNNPAGLGNYSRILLNALMKDFPENEYLLFTPKSKEEFYRQLNGHFKIILPETKLQKSFHSLWRSFGLIKQLQYEQANIYHGLSNELPFNIHRSGVKTVVTIHDLIFLKHKEQYPFFDRQMYERKTRYAAKYADKIIAVSEETKRDIVKFYKTPESKIEVIYPGVAERFQHEGSIKQENLVKYNLPAKFILNVGSFFPRKNHKTLIGAFALVKDKIEESLVLIGSQGILLKEIEQLIQQKNLQQRVKILTQVSDEDMPAIYRQASAFVFPSLYEGFGIPILESLFSKVPVITSKDGCFEEAGGKDSLYLNPLNAEEIADAILKVLTDKPLRDKMTEHGLLHALSLNNKILAAKTMNVYRSL